MQSKHIAFKITMINHSKVFVFPIKVASDAPAGEILDLLEDIFEEKVNATQIIALERLSDPVNDGVAYANESTRFS